MAEATEHHRPGEPPPVRDEAADTPLWLPVLGLCFLVLGAFLLIWQSTNAADEAAVEEAAAPAEDRAAAEGEAAPDEAPADEAPADEAPAEAH